MTCSVSTPVRGIMNNARMRKIDIHPERQTDGDMELFAKVLRGIADVDAGRSAPAETVRARVLARYEAQ